MQGNRVLDVCANKVFFKRLVLSGLCVVVTSILIMYIVDYHKKCGKDHIKEVCSEYEQGMIAGSLCHDLCQTETVTFDTCLSTVQDKAIYKGTWRKEEIILKIHNNIEYYSFSHLTTRKEYKNEIGATVNMLFGECGNCSILAEKLTTIADIDKDGQLSLPEAMTMVTLLRTSEPLILLVINNSKHLPKMYGYCGRLYAVEKLPVIADSVFGYSWNLQDVTILPSLLEPVEDAMKKCSEAVYKSLKNFDIFKYSIFPFVKDLYYFIYQKFLRDRIPSFEERFNFSMSLLDIISTLSNTPYGMFQSCDNHLGNFGLSENSEVKIIDADEVLPVHHIQNILGNQNCKRDRDCRLNEFLECSSKCNRKTGFCSKELKAGNLESIFSNSLSTVFRNIDLDFNNQNRKKLICLDEAIFNLVEFCSQLSAANSVPSQKSIDIVKQKLLNISRGVFDCS